MTIKKVSVFPPTDLIADAAQRGGGGHPSASVARGVRRLVLADRRRHYLAELEAESGPLTEAEREEGRRLWSGEI